MKTPSVILLLSSALLIGPFALQSRDVEALFEEALRNTEPDQIIPYKTLGETELSLNVFQPEEESALHTTAILWLHGGGWEAGEAAQLFPHCAYFASLGYVAISADYRLAGVAENTIFDCIEDVRDAFYWIHQNAENLGFSADRIVVAGESAGGHLAACVGYIPDGRTSGIPNPQPFPRATILVNPITDLTAISWAMTKPGLSPGDPALGESISPVNFVGPESPPALLMHGEADTVVPPAQSADFAKALHAAGRPANLRLWEGKTHAFFLYLEQFNLIDKPIIHLSLLQAEAFLQMEKLNGYPAVDGHFSPVHLFAGNDGFRSFSELFPHNGLLYGSTYRGGPDDAGTLFSFNPQTREHKVLHAFNGSDGREVFNGLTTDGTRIFGVCKFGGDHDGGTLFAFQPDGSGFDVLHHFDKTDNSGFYPHAAPVALNGVLYGTTYHGGVTTWGGALYQYALPGGPFTRIHSFTTETSRHPTGQLTPAGDWLYGTASDFFQHDGGYHGSLYRIHRETHAFELLHLFNGASEGGHPCDRLYYDGTDRLFGTTFGKVFTASSMGTLVSYSISSGTLSILHDFASHPGTGSKPNGSFSPDPGSGFLYAVSHGSNAEGGETGTLFRLLPNGSRFTLLHRFHGGLAGNTPMRSLAYANGSYYGVTAFGGLTTDLANPETGPGFIFRYTPNPDPSPSETELVEWLAGESLLVNQNLDSNHDGDALNLLEEFAFQGDPQSPESDRIYFLHQVEARLNLEVPVVRASLVTGLSPLGSRDLTQWILSEDYLLVNEPHSSGQSALRSLLYSWPLSILDEGPYFISFSIEIPK